MSLLNKKMEVYFSSNRIVNQPKIITDGYYKDFGYGFYCTNFENQAMRGALTKKKNHIVNVYTYSENLDLNCKVFEEGLNEWLVSIPLFLYCQCLFLHGVLLIASLYSYTALKNTFFIWYNFLTLEQVEKDMGALDGC